MSQTAAIVLIPARMAANRLPGKPLADIHGEPMIVHVWRRAIEAELGRVVVATDDAGIAGAIRAVGGEAVITRGDHVNGTSRIFEALAIADPDAKAGIVVNFQGDLPTIEAETVRAVMRPLAEPMVDIATIAAEITREEEKTEPSVVKMVGTPVGDRLFRALYFTRATAPSGEGPVYHHIGLYAFRRDALARYIGLPPTPLEGRERLEQLRALEHGMRIDVALVDGVPLGVDTPGDLDRARAMLAG
ncbi:MAG: 3-deoxy-manno-octulosonate cytidylyltransferase [Bauldia sp.]|uniref:3-deoxy-manno-octulosonate cytidylyltransferase n=1 Tax=Bauldia sp. TaxID=2575872 RepID=UPI001D659A72|nr:3-deoxy-manno-octulosonate cytidylyltransferase [Bauldia sp.]MCB1495155.1 3-deoxy-manno-octulosonate cytidylyltransferase [Bauldia sp.]